MILRTNSCSLAACWSEQWCIRSYIGHPNARSMSLTWNNNWSKLRSHYHWSDLMFFKRTWSFNWSKNI